MWILKEHMVKDINEVLQTRRLIYFGHVIRMEKDIYPNILMHGYTHGRRPRGRPRKRWLVGLDNITEDCEELNLTIHLANDRVKWRNTVHNKGCQSARRGHRLRCRSFKSKVKSSERLCVFDLYGAMHILIFLLTSFSLPFSDVSLVGLTLDMVD